MRKDSFVAQGGQRPSAAAAAQSFAAAASARTKKRNFRDPTVIAAFTLCHCLHASQGDTFTKVHILGISQELIATIAAIFQSEVQKTKEVSSGRTEFGFEDFPASSTISQLYLQLLKELMRPTRQTNSMTAVVSAAVERPNLDGVCAWLTRMENQYFVVARLSHSVAKAPSFSHNHVDVVVVDVAVRGSPSQGTNTLIIKIEWPHHDGPLINYFMRKTTPNILSCHVRNGSHNRHLELPAFVQTYWLNDR